MNLNSQQFPTLPSVLPSSPALQDVKTTAQQISAGLGRVTNPTETPIYICAWSACNRLFPSKERLLAHRQNAHNTIDDNDIITWNE